MSERPFIKKTLKPNTTTLPEVLGSLFESYTDLNETTKHFSHIWNHSKSSGWMEKVSDSKKALYYFIPLHNSFKISMAIRESEKNAILEDNRYDRFHAIVNGAKKYSEGFNIQLEIMDAAEYEFAKAFIEIIISMR